MTAVKHFPAVLHGMGAESEPVCTLETWQERLSGGRPITRCRITDDPPALPDGPYDLLVEGHSISARKASGQWQLIFLSPEIDLDGVTDWTPGTAS